LAELLCLANLCSAATNPFKTSGTIKAGISLKFFIVLGSFMYICVFTAGVQEPVKGVCDGFVAGQFIFMEVNYGFA
jgi:hypothetical protein